MLTSHNVLKLFVFFLATIGTDAFSAGALATCAEGTDALGESVEQGGNHVFSGSLESQGTSFSINGMTLVPGTPVSFPAGEEIPFLLEARADSPFKGFLMRFQAPDGINTVGVFGDPGTDANVQVSTTCRNIPGGNVEGFTHKNPPGTGAPPRDIVQGMIRLDMPAQNVIIDISVVYERNMGYHSRYLVNFEDPPTEPPTPTPTKSPIDTATEPPTPTPTKSPVSTPTDPPTPAPTKSPGNTPTESPTPAPTKSPVKPDNTPAPTPAPSSKPTGDDLPVECNLITDFYLINPALDDNNKVLLPDVIDLAKFPHGRINIEAKTFDCPRPDNIECVELSFSGHSRMERKAPYALYGDRNGHFFEGKPHVGENQELKACTYTDRECRLDETCKSITVDVVEGPGDGDDLPVECNLITNFYLINPALDVNNKVLLPDVIDLAKFPRGRINIEAETFDCPRPDNIECVELSFSGHSRMERKAPYALYGDRNGHFFEGKPHVGENQELKACTYTDRECRLDETCKSVTVDVVEGRGDGPGDEPGDMPCDMCDNDYECGVCLMEVNDGKCPLDSDQLREMNRRNCSGRYFFESGGEEFCEGDGECGTIQNSDHDTCGRYEVYKKVSCKKDRGGNLRG